MALSEANALAQLVASIHILEELEKSVQTDIVSLEGTLKATTAGTYRAQVLAAVEEIRRGVSGVLSPAFVQRFLIGPLRDFAETIDAPERDFVGILLRLYTYMHDNSKTINSRGITYGTPSNAGGNTGNGVLHRVTVDANGYRLEGGHADVKVLRCVADQATAEFPGADRFRAIFEVVGADAARDNVEDTGSGVNARIQAISEDNSLAFLRNPGFDTFDGTQPTAGTPQTPSSTTAITGWTLDATTGVTSDVDTVYRTPPNVTTAKAIFFSEDRTLTQQLNQTTKAKLPRGVPIFFQVAVYRGSSADGTLTISVGAVDRAVTLSGLSNNAWTVITVPATLGADSWYANTAEDNFAIVFALTSNTTGDVGLDGVIMAPMVAIDGSFYALVEGTTPFAIDDKITVTDSESTRGVVQYWLGKRAASGVSLPSDNGGTETWADP